MFLLIVIIGMIWLWLISQIVNGDVNGERL